MSDILKHILVGEMIGTALSKSRKPALKNMASAFALGVISHGIMDFSEPDYTVNWFDRAELLQAAPFLKLQAGGILYVLYHIFSSKKNLFAFRLKLAAIIGAVIPDIIDGIYALMYPSAWYQGQLLFPWHKLTWQVNVMSMWATSAITGLLFAARFLSLPLYQGIKFRLAALRTSS